MKSSEKSFHCDTILAKTKKRRTYNMKSKTILNRILSLSLVAALSVSMLSGCTQTSETTALSSMTSATETTETTVNETEPVDRVASLVGSMTLEEKIGQMMIPSFRIWQDLRNTSSSDDGNAEHLYARQCKGNADCR